ncbi:StfH/YfcO family fimbrial adhesin [Escherichia albertii]|uniref:StfH/YfcO family fimbrial adhesin n=1 Tax=Escherichia albertii TaxID=208962 RepID=UPI0017B5B381|nr:StfH/YfcO family fimbrial adhesin [Escherichia albertii]EGE0298887.1 DUF2544 domain-containing protein [Escherichia albertii]EKD4813648.1 DUF2544 domain-containing protein [Escherichia albertii]MCI5276943.1 DUF2544 domain-containing protein [Escherichia albertii]MCZ8662402.1 StfH/YfcO family fimbrial adhesin [Escherichia albertii]MCZ8703790.1 StfH/YfcO family fimbrial adhesin [Escherichia albertii]
MKILRWLCCLVMLTYAVESSAAGHSVTIYYGIANDQFATVIFNLKILMPSAVYTGVYSGAARFNTGDYMTNESWDGPPPAPTVKLLSYKQGLNRSLCPGLPSNWDCGSLTFEIVVSASIESAFSCPWIVVMNNKYTASRLHNYESYQGPDGYGTLCPSVSVTPYDISWDENYVNKTKVLSLQSTGGVIEKTLSTYLMKDGKLCDSSQMDEAGGYCRWVAQMITFSSSGCDNANVTVTPNRHPITDKQLHDMVVQVDTSSRQPIDSTCRFQYTLNEL